MGVFDFVKEAGAKIGIGDSAGEKAEKADMAEAASKAARNAKMEAASDARASAVAKQVRARKSADRKEEQKERLAENKKAAGLERYLVALGVEIEDLDVRFDDGVATISGQAATQAIREKAILLIGNTSGVGQVHDEITLPDGADAESVMHVVVSGDTLSKIAKEVYGDAMKYPVIFEANRPMLSDPDKIFVGQVLRIPAL